MLHKTEIVWIRPDTGCVVVNFGHACRYDTVTTRRRMNQVAQHYGIGFRVYRNGGQTYVDTPHQAAVAVPAIGVLPFYRVH